MTEKKYAIVRVDNCPSKFEKGFNDYFVCDGRGKDMRLGADKINCNNCRYGDTKEQLIKKVEQGIIIASKKKQIYIANPKAFSKAVSKIIVEFLGVK